MPRQSVHCAAVAAVLRIDPHAIADRPEFRAVVDQGVEKAAARWRDAMRERLAGARDRLVRRGARLSRAELAAEATVSLEKIARWERETGETFAVSPSETYEGRVRESIAALTERGERVTTVGVCRETGVDRSLIEKRPALKELLHKPANVQPQGRPQPLATRKQQLNA